MHPFVLSGIGQTVQFAMRGVMNSISRWIYSFFRQKMVCVWVMNKDIPKHMGNLRENTDLFLKNSAHSSLQTFIADKPRGATVFWTITGAGKTYTLSHTIHEANHRFVYIDWNTIAKETAKEMFYSQIGLDPVAEKAPFGTYLPTDHGIFTTFVFDHYDCAMDKEEAGACNLITELSKDSTKSLVPYNLLVLVNKARYAYDMLTAHGWDNQGMFVRLIGNPYCGHWFSTDLKHLADERYNNLVDQSGKLAPMLSIRNGLASYDDIALKLRATRAQAEWDTGERLLWPFRGLEAV